ncbi:MAG: rhomboid family intramembrane serine protease [Actinomycetota bacterium]
MVIPLRDENPTHRFPIVTVALIVINVVVYFGLQLPKQSTESDLIENATESDEFVLEYAAIPCELQEGQPLEIGQFATGECEPPTFLEADRAVATAELYPDKNVWLSLLYSMFMHGSILHILGNMLFLWIFGNNVEDRLGPIGYVVFYLVTGLAAAAAHILLNFNSTTPVVGASGAIAGVMGAYIVWFPHARVMSLVPIFFFFTFVELPAAAVLGIWFVLQFFTAPNTGVAWQAHVGGFVAGAAIALALRPLLGPPRTAPRRPPPSWGRDRQLGWRRGNADDDDWGFGSRRY